LFITQEVFFLSAAVFDAIGAGFFIRPGSSGSGAALVVAGSGDHLRGPFHKVLCTKIIIVEYDVRPQLLVN
jgi:hypothetical protein